MATEPATYAKAAKRVLIADDHPLYRDALRAIVPQACPHADLIEAACQDDVLRQVYSDAAFDLIVLDLNLPGVVGLSCLRQVRERAPLTPVLIVSAADDPNLMSDVIQAGATGYVPKSAQRQMLVDAIEVVLGGGTYLPLEGMMALRDVQALDAGAHRAVQARHADLAPAPRSRAAGTWQIEQADRRRARYRRNHRQSARVVHIQEAGRQHRVQAALEARKAGSD